MKHYLRIILLIVATLWMWYQSEKIHRLEQEKIRLEQMYRQCNDRSRIV